MTFFWHVMRRTFLNIRGSLFPNLTTIGIIAVCMLIFSTFTLIAFNLASFLKIWEDKIEIVAYLKKDIPLQEVEALLKRTRMVEGVDSVKYTSPFDALAFMSTKLGSQKNLLEGIQARVLPSSFEILLKKDYRNSAKIKAVALQLKQFPQIEEIQYGEEWVETFSALVHILQVTQWGLGVLILLATIFIISNTVQVTISSRREEIEILRLLGASPALIQVPFYIEGLVHGLFGTGLAILFLFLLHQGFFLYVPPSIQAWLASMPVLFLPPETIGWILLGGMVLGLFGSFVASMQLLRHRVELR